MCANAATTMPSPEAARGGARRLLIAVAGLVLAALVTAVPAEASFPGRSGRIAFTTDDGVGSVNANGGGYRLLARDDSQDDPYAQDCYAQPAFSASGTRIAMAGCGVSQLYVGGADGTRLRGFELRYPVEDPSWSPDGRRLAFTPPGCDTCLVAVVDRHGGGLRRLGLGFDPAWSPTVAGSPTPTRTPR